MGKILITGGDEVELGEKILQARQEAGLSQRQLCGDEITRNMLSQIEHGTARPSMKTLAYLAARLGKPLSFFLDEDAEENSGLVAAMTLLRRAEEALAQGKHLYAAELLEKVPDEPAGLRRHRQLLLARVPGVDLREICEKLPSLDEELLLRARAALEAGEAARAEHLLEAMEDRSVPEWNLLRGRLLLGRKAYAPAAEHFHRAEKAFPEETAACLEQCYRELGDYKQAYFYACRQKK